ncbi:LOW QUALITY PROTEIN: probable RNA polymerase II nuclear localization protein SLC7A6OS [Callorhinchus milii]|uniref:LOW QUALITY PROTEIN: probable RNA polymerase II nuclear localization protein SLC7A6OS n=1 Tax=Callorhinchus milii TaxID=7868 RepID=UPI001C3F7768|nr:LOW QUALITY PROTEIN: probable RNA polymerase II nuclear localization protein SLC7A6OS [Callorhinchus milii]
MAATVLRVKRKRGAEPAEALLLACKRLRPGGAGGAAGDGPHSPGAREQVQRALFKLAATVSSQDDPVQKHVREALSKDRALQSLKPSATSGQRIQTDVRSSHRAASQDSRYKVIARHRKNISTEGETFEPQSGDTKDTHHPATESSTTPTESEKEPTDKCKEGDAVAGDSKGGNERVEDIQVFDVIKDDEQLEKAAGDPENTSSKDPEPGLDDIDVILCNSVKMIREKLTVSDSGEGADHRESAEEYVYDIYYTDSFVIGECMQSIISLVPYYEENELVGEEMVQDEAYDDEDDENEESNWRNDYPDEDEFDNEDYWDSEKDEEGEDDCELDVAAQMN